MGITMALRKRPAARALPIILALAMMGALFGPGEASGEEAGTLVITKATSGGIVPDNLGFAFDVVCTLDSETIYEFPPGEYLVLGQNESQIPGTFPVGTECSVTEIGTWNHEADWEGQVPGSLDGWTTVPSLQQNIVIESGFNELVFANSFDVEGGVLVIEKVVEGSVPGEVGFVFDIECSYGGEVIAAIDLENPESFGVGFGIAFGGQSLPVGTMCTLQEVGTWNHETQEQGPLDPWTVDPVEPIEIEIELGFNLVTFTNSLDLESGVLMIEKVVEGPFDGSLGFVFDISCSYLGEVVASSDPNNPEAFGQGLATAFGGQPLPVGTECTVAETGTWNHETQEPGPLDDWDVTPDGPATITIEPGFNLVTFINVSTQSTGSLLLTKIVESPDMSQAFAFGAECLDGEQVVFSMPDPDDPNGEPFVTGHGTQVIGDLLPVGVDCTVTELGIWDDTDGVSPLDGWTTDPESQTVEITIVEGFNEVIFTNTLDDFVPLTPEPSGTLLITKILDGQFELGPTGFAFDVACRFGDEVILSTGGDFGNSTVGEGSGTPFGGPALPVGTVCTVAEVGTWNHEAGEFDPNGLDGWTTDPADRTVEVTIAEGFNTATFTNTPPPPEPTGVLVIDKVVDGQFNGPFGFAFTITCLDGEEMVAGTNPEDPNELFVANGPQVFWQPIPIGAICTVVEVGTWDHEAGEFDPNGLDGWTTDPADRTVEVEILKGFNTATFTNTPPLIPTGRLVIDKVVEGPFDGSFGFAFSIECWDGDVVVAGTNPDDLIVANGPQVFWQPIPLGAVCEVVEVGTWNHETQEFDGDGLDGWTTTPESRTVFVAIEEDFNVATFINARPGASLTISKLIEGDGPVFAFDAYCEYDGEPVAMNEGEPFGVEPNSRETVFDGLPLGTECTVTEVGYFDESGFVDDLSGWETTPSREQTVVLSEARDYEVAFTNRSTHSWLVVNKIVESEANGIGYEFSFSVVCDEEDLDVPTLASGYSFELGVTGYGECTVTETAAAPGSLGDWTTLVGSGDQFAPGTSITIPVVEGENGVTFVNQLFPNDPSINLVKTVGTVPGVCATTSEITVGPGTAVYYCYRVTNTGDVPFELHDLFDDKLGVVLDDFELLLAPDSSAFVISEAFVVEGTVINLATWTAFNEVNGALHSQDLVRTGQLVPLQQAVAQVSATSAATVNCYAPNPYLRACRPYITVANSP